MAGSKISVDPYQLTSIEASWSRSTLFYAHNESILIKKHSATGLDKQKLSA